MTPSRAPQHPRSRRSTAFAAVLALSAAPFCAAQSFKFDFGPGPVAPGYTQVLPTSKYTKAAGFGFDSCSGAIVGVNRGGNDPLTGDFIASGNDLPFSFSFDAPEGNYRVTVTIGDAQGPSRVTVNAESHRLMLEKIEVPAGRFVTKTFLVNRRDPKISTGGAIALKQRSWPNTNEPDMLNWDGRLTLEFADGSRQNVCAVEAVRIDTAVQVFLGGNSTVTDQEYSPWGSWGQMIPRFFNDKVSVVNLAESGLASSSFGNRLDKALSMMKPGEYMFLEFGHNDASESSYNTNMTDMINRIKAKQGIPVIVSPICRRYWDATGKIDNSTGQIMPYSAAARALAAQLNVGLIDLTAMTKQVLDALGKDNAKKLYVSYTQAELKAHGWTRFSDPSVDDLTHTNVFGAYEYAKCVRAGITAKLPDLAKYFLTDVPAFDPAKPDDADAWFAAWTWSPYPDVKGSSVVSLARPAGAVPDPSGLEVDPGSATVAYRLTAAATGESRILFTLYSMEGRMLAQRQVTGRTRGSFSWPALEALPPGDYFLELKAPGGTSQRISFTRN